MGITADDANPTKLRFNLGGRSVDFDFDSLVKAGETKTSLGVDASRRTLSYLSEGGSSNDISARALGSIFHLADISDVDTTTIEDNAILVYQKDAKCGENCAGASGWVGLNPTTVAQPSLQYILGADADGRAQSIMPPANNDQFYTLTWAANKKASWKQPTEVPTPPVDKEGYAYRLYLDPTTKEIVVHKVKE